MPNPAPEIAARSQPITLPNGAAPFSDAELDTALYSPAAAIDLLLAQRERFIASVIENRRWARMVGLLLLWTCLFSLPYGLVLSLRHAWQIATLFLGSVAICLPSLHVVSAYLGLRVHAAQSFSFAAIIAAVAAIFSFGFAPILWFLQATTEGASGRETLAELSGLLLGTAALAGILHGIRCLRAARHLDGGGFSIVVLLWQILLLFIGWRMSGALGLR